MIAAVLRAGSDDWVGVWELPFLARSTGAADSPQEERIACIQVVRELLASGWATVGDVTDDGFRAWPLTHDQAVSRIETEWQALPNGPNLGDIGWINLSETGEAKAAELRRS